jgi:hypothetical protein
MSRNIPAAIVARLLKNMPCREREAALADIIKHAADGLRIIRGQQAAAEHLYMAADAMVQREAA